MDSWTNTSLLSQFSLKSITYPCSPDSAHEPIPWRRQKLSLEKFCQPWEILTVLQCVELPGTKGFSQNSYAMHRLLMTVEFWPWSQKNQLLNQVNRARLWATFCLHNFHHELSDSASCCHYKTGTDHSYIGHKCLRIKHCIMKHVACCLVLRKHWMSILLHYCLGWMAQFQNIWKGFDCAYPDTSSQSFFLYFFIRKSGPTIPDS